MSTRLTASKSLALAASVCVIAAAAAVRLGHAQPAGAPAVPDDLPKRPYKHLTVGPVSLNPGPVPTGFPYIDMYDSAVAAPEVHHVRYIDSHVRFVEVAYFPGVRGKMHGHAYSSVFAIDAPAPRAVNVPLDEGVGPRMKQNGPPKGAVWPTCNTMGPQPPHAETNLDTWPHHFYRLEFRRVDGTDLDQHWREWYPRLSDPPLAVKEARPGAGAAVLTPDWPYAQAYDSYLASPNTNRLLYEDPHVRLIEVSIRPGETELMNGNPYPSVLAFDNASGQANTRTRYLDPASPHNGQDRSEGAAPPEFTFPTCATLGPQAPHATTNHGKSLVHYYRIEFKRLDGEGLRTRWAEWYPWMAKVRQAYDANPYPLNY